MALNTTFSLTCTDTEGEEEGISDEFVYSLYYALGDERKVYIGHTFDPSDFAADEFFLPPGLEELLVANLIHYKVQTKSRVYQK